MIVSGTRLAAWKKTAASRCCQSALEPAPVVLLVVVDVIVVAPSAACDGQCTGVWPGLPRFAASARCGRRCRLSDELAQPVQRRLQTRLFLAVAGEVAVTQAL